MTRSRGPTQNQLMMYPRITPPQSHTAGRPWVSAKPLTPSSVQADAALADELIDVTQAPMLRPPRKNSPWFCERRQAQRPMPSRTSL